MYPLWCCAVDLVDQHVMEQAFLEFGLGYGFSNGVMRVVEVEAVLNKVFQLATRDRPQLLEPERCTEITLNWILKCFDRFVSCIGYVALFTALAMFDIGLALIIVYTYSRDYCVYMYFL